MNALTGYRANSLGNLSPRPDQREAAAAAMSSMSRARQHGMAKAAGLVKSATKAEESATDAAVSNATMDRDAFLQLLVLQMQNQDPTDPMDNSEMLSQLAQFSSLEQMNNLNDSFGVMSGNIDQLNFITANSLLGREIKAVNEEGDVVTGVVESVHLDGSLVYLGVDDQFVSMAGVLSIEPPATTGGEGES